METKLSIISSIEIITSEVIKTLMVQENISYDEAEDLFKSSNAYQILPTFIFDYSFSSYLAISKEIICLYYEEQILKKEPYKIHLDSKSLVTNWDENLKIGSRGKARKLRKP